MIVALIHGCETVMFAPKPLCLHQNSSNTIKHGCETIMPAPKQFQHH